MDKKDIIPERDHALFESLCVGAMHLIGPGGYRTSPPSPVDVVDFACRMLKEIRKREGQGPKLPAIISKGTLVKVYGPMVGMTVEGSVSGEFGPYKIARVGGDRVDYEHGGWDYISTVESRELACDFKVPGQESVEPGTSSIEQREQQRPWYDGC